MSIAEKLLSLKADFDSVYEKGKTAGKQAFSDAYQDFGDRNNYYSAYSGIGWNGETFDPKYPITCADPNISNPANSTNAARIFYGSRITEIKVPVTVTGIPMDSTFTRCSQLRYVEKLVINGVTKFTTVFNGCTELEHMDFSGSCIDISFTMKDCVSLNKGSIESLVAALDSGASGKTLTLSKTAVEHAFGSIEDTAEGEKTEWKTLKDTKPNWTFVLS